MALALPVLVACGPSGTRQTPGAVDLATPPGGADTLVAGDGDARLPVSAASRGPTLQLAPAVAPDRPQPVTASPLDDVTAARLTALLPGPAEAAGTVASPPLRGPAEPTDLPAAAVLAAPSPPHPVAGGPLTARGAPTGEVRRAQRISVTFDRPMEANPETARHITSIEPGEDGVWRWLDVRTLVFTPVGGQLPAATPYTVVIRAGARAADGSALAEDYTWSFQTARPRVVDVIPDDRALVRRDTPVALVFDQRVDPGSALKATRLTAGSRSQPLRLATDAELASFPAVAAAVAAAGDRAVALRPIAPLPDGEVANLTIGPGINAWAGPLLSTETQTYALRTLPALALTRSRCGFGAECRPGDPWTLELDHPLDEGAFDPTLLSVTPALADAEVSAAGRWITVRGAAHAGERYVVTLAPGLRDVHGQRLASPARATFDVGAAAPALSAPVGSPVVLTPGRPAALPVETVNIATLRVQIRRVTPADWPAWLTFTREAPRAITPIDPPGELVDSRVVQVAGARDVGVETPIDLTGALNEGRGHLIVSVAPTAEPEKWYQRQDLHRWVDATGLAADVWADGERVTVWVTALATGAPVAGADVRLGGVAEGAHVTAATDADGMATLPLTALPAEGRGWLVIDAGGDVALVPDGASGLGGPSPWRRAAGAERARWLIIDGGAHAAPRGRWRAHGWVRQVTAPGDAAVLALPAAGSRITWAIHDARRRRIDRGTAELDASGGFTVDARLSSRSRLGDAVLSLELERDDAIVARHEHALTVVDPDAVTPTARVDASPSRASDPGEVRLTLRAGIPGAEPVTQPVTWSAALTPSPAPALAPDGFVFSVPSAAPPPPARLVTPLDDEGEAHAVLRLPGGLPTPARIAVDARVDDRERAADTTVVVARAGDAVGLRLSQGWAVAGDEVGVELVAVAPDGSARVGRAVAVRADRVDSSESVSVCERTTVGPPIRCAWKPPVGRWTVAVTGPEGEEASAALVVVPAPGGRSKDGPLLVVPDQPVHAPGDTARILVRAPFPDAAGVVTVARDGLLLARPFTVGDGVAVLELPVTAAWRPGVVVEAHVVATGVEGPSQALGRARFAVPPVERALSVELSVPATVSPGERVPVSVRVVDAAGAAVRGAAVSLVATPSAGGAARVPDPMARFWGSRPAGVVAGLGRDRLPRAERAFKTPPVEGLADAVTTARATPHTSGALVGEAVVTDSEGRARLSWRTPEAEGSYRVDAVAVAGADRFGRGEAQVDAHDGVSVDVRWPPRLLVGDRVDVPVVIHNRGAAGATVAFAARGDGIDLPAGAGWRAAVPGHRTVTAALPVVAARAGAGGVAVAWEAPSSAGPQVTAGQLVVSRAGKARRRQVDGAVPREGSALTVPAADAPRSLTLRLAASRAVALGGAVVALDEPEEDAPEPLASRIIAWSALAETERLAAAAGLPDEDAVRARIAGDLDLLRGLQEDDGGFSGGRRGAPSTPWISVYVAQALARAEAVGVSPPGELLERSRRYLAQIDRHLPRGITPRARASLVAHALYVRALLGDDDVDRAKAVIAGARDGLDVEAAAMLLTVVRRKRAARGEAEQLRSQLVAWADGERPPGAPEDAALTLATPARSLAVVLDALVTDAPKGARTARLVETVLAARRPSGSLGGDEADAWAVVALSRAFAAEEQKRPDVTARAWVDGALRVDERLRTRGGAVVPVTIAVPARSEPRVSLTRRGSGPLFFALVEEAAAPSSATAAGFVVSRRLVAVDDPQDVRQEGDGTWRVRLGARVRVEITVVTTEGHGRVVIHSPGVPGLVVDPLTARADGQRSRDPRGGAVWSFDGRVSVSVPRLTAGPHVFSYVARPTMRARVTVPGVAARRLANRAVRGTSAPDVLRVE